MMKWGQSVPAEAPALIALLHEGTAEACRKLNIITVTPTEMSAEQQEKDTQNRQDRKKMVRKQKVRAEHNENKQT